MLDYTLLVKAALLHDIGKLCYRAGLAKEAETYPAYGARWLARLLPEEDKNAEQLLRCISYHRRRDFEGAELVIDDMAYLVYLADAVAFGAEKMERQPEDKFDASLCLESVFNYFSDNDTYKRYFLPKKINLAKEINSAVRDNIKATPEDYLKLLKTIENKLKQKPLMEMYPHELLQLLEDTLYYVPLTVREDLPHDISLWEHVKLTAALAVSIAHYFESAGITDYASICRRQELEQIQHEPVFLTVSADIAGIYGFLTAPSEQSPLAAMRGRSIYLECLSLIIAEELVNSLKLSRANIIYTGGGRLYLIAPNTQQMKKGLDDFADYVNNWLLQNFGTQLYVSFGMAEFTPVELVGRQIGSDVLARADLQVENNKKNRYSETVLAGLFNPASEFNCKKAASECCVCHRNVSAADEGRKDELCQNCRALLELGKASFLEDRVLAVCTNRITGCMAVPGYNRVLYLKMMPSKDLAKFRQHNKIVYLYSSKGGASDKSLYFRVRRCDYCARDAKTGRMPDMEALAERSMGETYTGVKRLGVLMADVDAIGVALKAGFYRNDLPDPLRYLTLARQASLSGRLSFFFKSILNEIFKGELQFASGKTAQMFRLFNKHKQQWRNIHVIYSGGDNIFLLGAWDDVVEVAVDIHRAFEDYTNGKLAFSAGIGMFTPDFPVSQMFIQAELLKKAAKDVPGTGKIALFGQNADYVSGPEGGLAHVYDWDVFEKLVCGEKLGFLLKSLSFGTGAVHDKIKTDRNTLYKLHGVLAAAEGKFNLAHFAYAVSLFEPKTENPQTVEVYNNLRGRLYAWALDTEGRRQLLTALELLIYSLPNAPKEDY